MLPLHLGDHTGLHLSAVVAHMLEADHLLLVGTALLVGVWVYRQKRSKVARVRVETERRP